MVVIEPGDDESAAEVDHLGRWAAQRQDIAIGADGDDVRSAHRDRFSPRAVRIASPDDAVMEDQVRRLDGRRSSAPDQQERAEEESRVHRACCRTTTSRPPQVGALFLEAAAKEFLDSLRHDRITEQELTIERASANIVLVSGMLVFAPPAELERLRNARAESGPTVIHREGGTPDHLAARDVEILAVAIETYLADHDALPQETRGRRVNADALKETLRTPVAGLLLSFVDPWQQAYQIAVSPSGLRAAVYTRGEHDALSAENEATVQQVLRGELTSAATMYGESLMVTGVIPKKTP